MRMLILLSLVAVFAVTSGVFVPPRPGHRRLIGSKECTWGPSYWCQNITTAAGCHAVKHCIQTVWEHQQLPPDTSSVCQICLDMVKQARDQLRSNETQEEIKEVFEGSCALIHFKTIVTECDKLVDEFIPELIDTLASQMNPQVVCSVAGLCNNERVHQLIAQESKKEESIPPAVGSCDGCHTVVKLMEERFGKMSRDDFLQALLEACGRTGSLSDGCSNIIITYFNEIYNHVKENFNPTDFCLMAGECSAKFHTHANVEITPMSHIGYVDITKPKDDLPCELCEQLVIHLRDILVTNTTEDEFKLVLQGLCKQAKSFKDECLGLVDEYYGVVYNFLVTQLDSHVICKMIGICPNNNTQELAPIMPLLPVQTAEEALQITPAPVIRINMAKDGSAVKVMTSPEEAQLPIERMMPPLGQQLYNPQTCVFCEYLLHYLQEAITNPSTEEEIKQVVDKACSKLPRTINATCVEFVDTYEPALVAILAQEIDPSVVCPLLKVCPPKENRDVEVFMKQESDGSGCPLCLFAVSELEKMVTNKSSEAKIKSALDKLCGHLPTDVAAECKDFVSTYTNELIDALMNNLTPAEVCVYLKLCTDHRPAPDPLGGNTITNRISDYTINGEFIQPEVDEKPQCVLCEFVMKTLQDRLKDNKTEEEIKQEVRHVCNILPKTVSQECNQFIDEYGDTVIQLLIAATEPAEICRMIGLCAGLVEDAKVEVFDCAACEALVYAVEKILANPKVDHDIDHVLEKACRALPTRDQYKCADIIRKYGKTIYDLVIHLADKGLICKEIGLCGQKVARPTRSLVGANRCTWGPSYWCASNANAEECGPAAKQHCQERVWKANTFQSA